MPQIGFVKVWKRYLPSLAFSALWFFCLAQNILFKDLHPYFIINSLENEFYKNKNVLISSKATDFLNTEGHWFLKQQ